MEKHGPMLEKCRDMWMDTEARMSCVETWVKEMRENHLPHINSDLGWIKERLSRGYRPPWTVAVAVSILSSLVVGLIVAMLKG